MMCYERALKVLCRMEYPTPVGESQCETSCTVYPLFLEA